MPEYIVPSPSKANPKGKDAPQKSEMQPWPGTPKSPEQAAGKAKEGEHDKVKNPR